MVTTGLEIMGQLGNSCKAQYQIYSTVISMDLKLWVKIYVALEEIQQCSFAQGGISWEASIPFLEAIT
jgi:hypothetical protein